MPAEDETQNLQSRRSFIKRAASGGLGVAVGTSLTGCGQEKPALHWDREADVVIAGGGGAGLSAAIEAGKAGAKVIVLEKMPYTGGDTILNGGIIAGNGDRLSKAKGIEVSSEEIYQFMLKVPPVFGAIDPDWARIIAEQCGPTIDWLLDLGVAFQDTVGPDPNYTTLPVMHLTQGGGTAFNTPLLEGAKKHGAQILLDTQVTRLITDDSGRVIGVSALSQGKPINVKSRRAVVLSTGGYAGNPEMMGVFNPDMIGIKSACSSGTTGDGLGLSMALGAVVLRTSYAPMLFPAVDIASGRPVEWHCIQGGGIAVGEDGKRFMNEDLTYMSGELPRAMIAQIRKQKNPHITLILMDSPQLQNEINIYAPELVTADSIEALATRVGLDPAALKASIDSYNANCAKKVDPDFGRKNDLIPLKTAPFYAVKVDTRAIVSTGGFKTNTRGQVMKFKHVAEQGPLTLPIPGLYGAGMAGQWNAVGGWTCSSAFTTGRIAGQNAAAEKPWA